LLLYSLVCCADCSSKQQPPLLGATAEKPVPSLRLSAAIRASSHNFVSLGPSKRALYSANNQSGLLHEDGRHEASALALSKPQEQRPHLRFLQVDGGAANLPLTFELDTKTRTHRSCACVKRACVCAPSLTGSVLARPRQRLMVSMPQSPQSPEQDEQ
jgi:hypothetical protein